MGQDDSCGICGEYYRHCKHYCKEHIPRLGTEELPLCGQKNSLIMLDDWEGRDINTDDICKKCKKIYGDLPQARVSDSLEYDWIGGDK